MFNKQQQRIRDACLTQDWTALADAICNPEQALEHSGPVKLTGAFSRTDRGYSSAGTLKPEPPVGPIRFDGALLDLYNQPDGDSDEAGENGFDIISRGVSKFQNPWVLNWATVDSTGTTAGGYFYSDGYKCNDAAGDDVTETPIRVFYQNASSLPSAGAVVSYLRDQNGVAQAMGQGGVAECRVWGKLDAELAYNNTTGVKFSIWTQDSGTGAWSDSGEDITLVFPPPDMASGTMGTADIRRAVLYEERWYALQTALPNGGNSGDILVWDGDSWAAEAFPIPDGTADGDTLIWDTGTWTATEFPIPDGTSDGDVLTWDGDSWGPEAPAPCVPDGTTSNDMLRWNGSAWVELDAPSSSGVWALTVTNGTMGWTECTDAEDFECP